MTVAVTTLPYVISWGSNSSTIDTMKLLVMIHVSTWKRGEGSRIGLVRARALDQYCIVVSLKRSWRAIAMYSQ